MCNASVSPSTSGVRLFPPPWQLVPFARIFGENAQLFLRSTGTLCAAYTRPIRDVHDLTHILYAHATSACLFYMPLLHPSPQGALCQGVADVISVLGKGLIMRKNRILQCILFTFLMRGAIKTLAFATQTRFLYLLIYTCERTTFSNFVLRDFQKHFPRFKHHKRCMQSAARGDSAQPKRFRSHACRPKRSSAVINDTAGEKKTNAALNRQVVMPFATLHLTVEELGSSRDMRGVLGSPNNNHSLAWCASLTGNDAVVEPWGPRPQSGEQADRRRSRAPRASLLLESRV